MKMRRTDDTDFGPDGQLLVSGFHDASLSGIARGLDQSITLLFTDGTGKPIQQIFIDGVASPILWAGGVIIPSLVAAVSRGNTGGPLDILNRMPAVLAAQRSMIADRYSVDWLLVLEPIIGGIVLLGGTGELLDSLKVGVGET